MNKLLCISLMAMTIALSAAEKNLWKHLPDEAVAAFCAPSLTESYEMFSETKLMQKFMEIDPMQICKDIFSEAMKSNPNADDMGEFTDFLADYNLGILDVAKFFQNEIGMALLVKAEDYKNSAIGIFWCNPAEDLSDKLHKAMEGFIEILEKNDINSDNLFIEDGDFNGYKTKLFIGKRGKGFYFAKKGNQIISAVGKKECIKEGLEKFILNIEAKTEGKLYEKIHSLKGYGEGHGKIGYEFLIDSAVAWEILRQETEKKGDSGKAVIDYLNLKQIGAGYFSFFMKDAHLSSSKLFLEIQEPREGVFKLLEQEANDFLPPAWLPDDVVQYAQGSMNLNDIYAIVKDIMIATQGQEQTQKSMSMTEMQIQSFLGTNMEGLLSSFGKKHIIVKLPLIELDAKSFVQDRLAFIWEIENEEVFNKIMTTVPMFLGGQAKTESINGFSGFRNNMGMEMGAYVGHGFLTVVVAPAESGTIDDVLSMLSKQTTKPLLENTKLQELTAMMEKKKGIAYAYADTGKELQKLSEIINSPMFARQLPEEIRKIIVEIAEKDLFKEPLLIPSVMGLSVSSEGIEIEAYQFIE